MCNKIRTLSLIILMFFFMPSIFAQGFWQRLGQAAASVLTGAAENYVGSTLNDKDREAWNEISNDINNGLGLDNNYVNVGNKLQEGKTTDAVVNMGVTAASNSGNQTLITVSKTVQAQNDYVNNVSSGMDQKTAQDAAARQISDALLDDMEERERIAAEKRRQERVAAERRNEYNSSNTYTTSSSTSSNTQYSTPNRSDSKEMASANTVEVFTVEEPEFPGGPEALNSFLAKEIQYPEVARSNGIEGTVLVKFEVEEDGRVSNAKVIVPLFPDCDKEAVRGVMAMPKWKPGTSMGKPVRCVYQIPILFNMPKIQPTFNYKAEECQNQIKEYQQLINSGISSEFLQYREENMILLYQSLTDEYRNQTEEYQQLINNGISSEFLKYREETLNNMYKSIVELTQQLNEILQNK